jgi:microcin C transport system substrate-binding protein
MRSQTALRLSLFFLVLFLLPLSCSSNGSEPSAAPHKTEGTDVTIRFPEGDPSVPVAKGGPGFAPSPDSGWATATDFQPEGSSEAVKGGAVRYWMRFPPTLRIVGKDSSTSACRVIEELCYESLLERHSDTLDFIPRLASHWWISDDKLTFRYRINPRAHWADGLPVTADDVIASWQLLNDSSILQPSMQVVYGHFERPKALSKYLVEIQAKQSSWRNFIYLSTLKILPAHHIGGLSGKDFLTRYQFQAVVGSGPYELRNRDVKKGKSITFRRRSNYWGRHERFAVGRFNFDLIRLVSTEDSVLALEKAKKGELDILPVGKAKDWALDLPRLDQVDRGLLVMCRVQNDRPIGADGIVINMRVPPLDDVRMRKALAHLYNRKKLISKLFYGLYFPLASYFPEATPDEEIPNDPLDYDPEEARRLLRQSGWKKFNRDGILIKDGRPLKLELIYSSKSVERYLSLFQEDCRRAGVKIHLKQLTRASRFQTTYGNRNFQLATQGWSGSVDPSPETAWLSTLADQKNNNNLVGFKDKRVDDLCRAYEEAYDPKKRSAILREIDQRIFDAHPCVLGWASPDIRLTHWNRFGRPDGYIGRTSGPESVLTTWWVDPAREKSLKSAKLNPDMSLDPGPRVIRYWHEQAARLSR